MAFLPLPGLLLSQQAAFCDAGQYSGEHSVLGLLSVQGSVTLKAVWPDAIAMLQQGLLLPAAPGSSFSRTCFFKHKAYEMTSEMLGKGSSCSVLRVALSESVLVRPALSAQLLAAQQCLPSVTHSCTCTAATHNITCLGGDTPMVSAGTHCW